VGTRIPRKTASEPSEGTVVALPGVLRHGCVIDSLSTFTTSAEQRRYLGFITGNSGYVSANCVTTWLRKVITCTDTLEWYTSDGAFHTTSESVTSEEIVRVSTECYPTVWGQLFGWSGGDGLQPGFGYDSNTGLYLTIGGNQVDVDDPNTWVGSLPETAVGELTLPVPTPSEPDGTSTVGPTDCPSCQLTALGLEATAGTTQSSPTVQQSGVSFGVYLYKGALNSAIVTSYLQGMGINPGASFSLDTNQLLDFLDVFRALLSQGTIDYIIELVNRITREYPAGTTVRVIITLKDPATPGGYYTF